MTNSMQAAVAVGSAQISEQTLMQAAAPPSSMIESLNTPISVEDLETARSSITRDLCFTVSAMAAHTVRAVLANPQATHVKLPRICKNCLVDAIPRLVERATGRSLEYVWVDELSTSQVEVAAHAPQGTTNAYAPQGTTNAYASQGLASSHAPHNSEKPQIGIVGNPLIVFDPFMNDNLVNLLESLGCQPVLPNPDLLFTEDVRYIEQLHQFEQRGITDVIYLQSFSCLKGHLCARGALRSLKRQFPNVNITVLDYDPEASALNRENRVRLVVEAAKTQQA